MVKKTLKNIAHLDDFLHVKPSVAYCHVTTLAALLGAALPAQSTTFQLEAISVAVEREFVVAGHGDAGLKVAPLRAPDRVFGSDKAAMEAALGILRAHTMSGSADIGRVGLELVDRDRQVPIPVTDLLQAEYRSARAGLVVAPRAFLYAAPAPALKAVEQSLFNLRKGTPVLILEDTQLCTDRFCQGWNLVVFGERWLSAAWLPSFNLLDEKAAIPSKNKHATAYLRIYSYDKQEEEVYGDVWVRVLDRAQRLDFVRYVSRDTRSGKPGRVSWQGDQVVFLVQSQSKGKWAVPAQIAGSTTLVAGIE